MSVNIEREIEEHRRISAVLREKVREMMALSSSKELSIAVTRLRESIMWFEEDLEQKRYYND